MLMKEQWKAGRLWSLSDLSLWLSSALISCEIWMRHFTTLSLSFLICEMRLVVNTLRLFVNIKWYNVCQMFSKGAWHHETPEKKCEILLLLYAWHFFVLGRIEGPENEVSAPTWSLMFNIRSTRETHCLPQCLLWMRKENTDLSCFFFHSHQKPGNAGQPLGH